MPSRTQLRFLHWLFLALVLLIALLLRAYEVEWGLPEYFVPDEKVFSTETAERMASRPPRIQDFFYPHLQLRTIDSLHRGLVGAGAWSEGLSEGVRLGRWLNVWLGVATVLMTFGIGVVLFRVETALAAAAFLAVAPAAVANAHLNGSDGPLMFWVTASTLLAALGFRSARAGWCIAAGAAAGLAGAVKYPGLAAVLPALWACLWAGPSRIPRDGMFPKLRRPTELVALAGVVSFVCVVAFSLGCPACVTHWQTCLDGIQFMGRMNYEYGSSAPIPIEGWLAHRYWFQLVAVLPFCLGFVACLAGYLGLSVMARRKIHEFLFVGSFLLPFFAVIGGSSAAYPRYFLPILPLACLATGFLANQALVAQKAWRFGLVALLVLGFSHSLLVSWAVARGYNEDSRIEAARVLSARAAQLSKSRPWDPAVTVGIEGVARDYDGLEQHLRSNSTLVFSSIVSEEAWLLEQGQDFIVVSTPTVVRWRRRTMSPEGPFWRALIDGELGYEVVKASEPSFAGHGVYAALDPLLIHSWTNGDIGFSIYERRAKRPPRTSAEPRKGKRRTLRPRD